MNLAAGGSTGIGGFLTFANNAVRSHFSSGSIPVSYQLLVAGNRARYFQSQIADS